MAVLPIVDRHKWGCRRTLWRVAYQHTRKPKRGGQTPGGTSTLNVKGFLSLKSLIVIKAIKSAIKNFWAKQGLGSDGNFG